MLKERRQVFEFFFMGADLIVVSIAWLLAFWLRFDTDLIPVEKGIPPMNNYVSLLLFIWLIWAFVFKRVGLYRAMRFVRRARELFLLLQGNLFSLLVFIAVTYLFREKDVPMSRLVFIYFGVLAVFLTSIERLLLRYFLHEIRRRGYNLRYMLIVGAGQLAGDLVARIRAHRELGIQLVGCLGAEPGQERGPHRLAIVGHYTELPRIVREMDLDQVLVALPLEDNQYLPDIMAALKDSLLDVKVVPDLSRFISVGGAIEEFEGLPVISVQASPLEGFNYALKRGFDILLGAVCTILLSPLMLLIALAVRLSSRGPILYKQERVSFDGSRFNIYKFRTMNIDAEAQGPQWSKRGDNRATLIGGFLRRYSLDELPQLFNVLRGDMSLVGPRPERPIFIQEFRKHVPRYMLRHKVPAGMTGWAQINGWRGDTSIDKRIEFDMYYVENWSLWLDLKIILLTLFRGIKDSSV